MVQRSGAAQDARRTCAHSAHDATTGTISLSAVEKDVNAAAQSREASATSSKPMSARTQVRLSSTLTHCDGGTELLAMSCSRWRSAFAAE